MILYIGVLGSFGKAAAISYLSARGLGFIDNFIGKTAENLYNQSKQHLPTFLLDEERILIIKEIEKEIEYTKKDTKIYETITRIYKTILNYNNFLMKNPRDKISAIDFDINVE